MNTRLNSVCAFAARFRRLTQIAAATLLAISFLGAPAIRAQSNTEGYIYGSGAPAGSTVLAENLQTGMKRDASADASGSFRLSSLPTGSYKVTLRTPGKEDQVLDNVLVSVGTGTSARFGNKEIVSLEKYVVSAGSISPIDVSSVESVTVFNQAIIRELPVARDTTSVALLAPGTTKGVGFFNTRQLSPDGGLASFDGSSVGENAYFVNGFNLTNFRNGLGGGSVPFEFYEQFQVKEGGYSAEFGRATGGVINATTKRGSNTFTAGANVYYSPDFLRANSPSVFLPNGDPYTDRSRNYVDTLRANIFAGGPIIKNKLFYYALVEERRNHQRNSDISTFNYANSKDPFYAGKLDWNITDNQTVDITAISDKHKTLSENFVYDYGTKALGASNGVTTEKRGGKDYIFHYSGKFTPDFTLSALYGKSSADYTDAGAGDSKPFIYDGRSGALLQLGSASQLQPAALSDFRKQTRVDGEYAFNIGVPQRLRFGVDREEVRSDSNLYYSGHMYYRYYATTPGAKLPNGGTVPAGVTQYSRNRVYENGGSFTTNEDAYYVEDNAKFLDDRLLLSIGIRNETYDNKNALGASFVKMKNQWAPRIGASFDPAKDGQSKFYANFSRVSLPVALNTNIRLAGQEIFNENYYALNSINADGTPVLGAKIGDQTDFSDGSLKPPGQIVDHNLKPMYQDEYIVGYQRALNKDWTVGVRAMYRNVGRFIEDMTMDQALNAYAAANNISGFAAGGNDYYVLSNPGQNVTFDVDFGDGKGTRTLTFTPAQLGYPKAQRKYAGLEFTFERLYDGKWFMQGSYTHSYSWGNDEGSVLSDNGQTDAGLTELFDHPGLMDHSYGYLANDKRHKFKIYGAYNLTSEFQAGANLRVESGMPLNALGVHPTDPFAAAYGAASFYVNGQPSPRASAGRAPWVSQIDLSFKYTPEWGHKKVSMGLDLFNILNSSKETEANNVAEQALGVPNPAYGLPYVYQPSRSGRISMSYTY